MFRESHGQADKFVAASFSIRILRMGIKNAPFGDYKGGNLADGVEKENLIQQLR